MKEVGTVSYTSTIDDSNKGNVVITNSRTPEVTEVASRRSGMMQTIKMVFVLKNHSSVSFADGQEVAVKRNHSYSIIGRQALRIYL